MRALSQVEACQSHIATRAPSQGEACQSHVAMPAPSHAMDHEGGADAGRLMAEGVQDANKCLCPADQIHAVLLGAAVIYTVLLGAAVHFERPRWTWRSGDDQNDAG